MTTNTAFLTGFSAFLPNEPVDNDAIETVLGHVNRVSSIVKRRILMQNGITSRDFAIDPATGQQTHTNAQMTAEAVQALARKTGFNLRTSSASSVARPPRIRSFPVMAAWYMPS